MKNNNPIRVHSRSFAVHKGVTLPEMLVAVAITVGMLAVIGAVFKSASDAAGKANANNDIMQQLRAVTRQIDQDFTGLRPDMPLAILWEAHTSTEALYPALGDPDDGNRFVRYDRIVFFANGDFQCPNGPGSTGYLSANLARIFYGQSAWNPNDPTLPPALVFDAPLTPPETLNTEPPRQILTRRAKLLTADTSFTGAMVTPTWVDWYKFYIDGAATKIWGNGLPWSIAFNYPLYDYCPIENETLAFWKNEPFVNFYNYYFLNGYYPAASASIIRRPSINAVQTLKDYAGVQRLYLLPDVTDFKIELWFPGATEWFPNEQDVAAIHTAGLVQPMPFYGYVTAGTLPNIFGFFWNKPNDGTPYTFGPPSNSYILPDFVDWRGEEGIQGIFDNYLGPPALSWTPQPAPAGRWPEAIKFTFTLYDKHRRHFPAGQTFSYIVQLPPRP